MKFLRVDNKLFNLAYIERVEPLVLIDGRPAPRGCRIFLSGNPNVYETSVPFTAFVEALDVFDIERGR